MLVYGSLCFLVTLLSVSAVQDPSASESSCSYGDLKYLCDNYEVCNSFGLFSEDSMKDLCNSLLDDHDATILPTIKPTTVDSDQSNRDGTPTPTPDHDKDTDEASSGDGSGSGDGNNSDKNDGSNSGKDGNSSDKGDSSSSGDDSSDDSELPTSNVYDTTETEQPAVTPDNRIQTDPTTEPFRTDPTTDPFRTDESTRPEITVDTTTVPAHEETDHPGLKVLPKITIPPLNITVPPGGTAKFQCVSKGAPTPQTTITKKDETIIPSNDSFTQLFAERESQISTIQETDNIVKANEGWYRCVSCNYYGCAMADAYLRVLDLCEGVTCQHPKVCTADYDAGTASCQCPDFCGGNFAPAPLCTNYCETKFSECVMKNDACRDNRTDVTVMYQGTCKKIQEPQVTGIKDDAGEQVNQIKQYTEEEIMTLVCAASGNPEPEIIWYKAEKEVGNGAMLSKKVSIEDSGSYNCVARNCMNKVDRSGAIEVLVTPKPTTPKITTPQPTTAPLTQTPEISNLIIKAPRSTCQVYGDPHFQTFDSQKYDFHGQCDYVLAMDCQAASWFVYGRMRKCGRTGGSCLATITIYYKDDIIELMRGWLVNYYGKKVMPKNHVNETIYVGEKANFTIFFDGKYLEVSAKLDEEILPNGDKKIYELVVRWDGYVSAMIQSPMNNPTCGLCGNNDGNPNNEFQGRRGLGGTPTEFGESWKIDRLGLCPAPTEKLTPKSVCGGNYDAVKAECERIFSIPNFDGCEDLGHDKKEFIEGCIVDTCEGNMDVKDLPPKCMAAHAYAMRCGTWTWNRQTPNPIVGWFVDGWEKDANCPTEKERYQPILDSGCPQPSLEEEMALKETA